MDGLGKMLYGKATDRVKATQNEPKTEITTLSTFRQKDKDPLMFVGSVQASERGAEVKPQSEQPMGNSEQAKGSQRGPSDHAQSKLESIEGHEARQGLKVRRGIEQGPDQSLEDGPDQGVEEGPSPGPEDSKVKEEVNEAVPKHEVAALERAGLSQPVTALFEEMPSGPTDVPKFSYVEEHSSLMEVSQI
jgi:hypothetical protein